MAGLIALSGLFVAFGSGVRIFDVLAKTQIGEKSIYDVTFGDNMLPGALTSWILMVVGLVSTVLSLVLGLALGKKKESGILSIVSSLLFLASGVLYFFIGTLGGSKYAISTGSLALGILLVFGGLFAIVYAIDGFTKEEE
jgi:Zn-dependent protease with chaperone function